MVTITQNKDFHHVVLVVDDNSQARELISLLLAGDGFKVIAAENGYEALMVWEETAIDLVLTDLNMPCMNGNELLAKIRAKGGGKLPAVCISAQPGQASADFDSIIAKPFRIEQLLTTVRELLTEHRVLHLKERSRT